MDFSLQETTSRAWLDAVMADFDTFLLDHASCEKKASGMAISMISHYPDKPDLVKEMLNLAIEEMSHFRDVVRIILDRKLEPAADSKDEYVNRLHKAMDKGKEAYMLDRLLIASIVEARGAERFGMIAAALPQGKLKKFYQAITDSESRHYQLFLELAENYYAETAITPRLNELLDIEAQIIRTLPFRAALH
ncbi:tRNA-(ms[2]io[6]A)-hydroxylase [Gammaproteobacteria bacterium]|jgi:tRNA-(ms[2]io[6]A)-hydroxylase|nr:tRNA-(ms[2]io[6]A)-hydroxylase [Gammaproteobacteria bacterium]MBT6043092.1 tRNA-(ms[2]io[6]A)-hydroxylase [Gammaproteobacteria bacterium]MDA9908892.1 tRNA-(ms[2]io[6]A)-hydroxylase [Gammaproteobacteria bacterium]